jgi:hypothetical protein
MNARSLRSLSLVFVALTLVAAGLACGQGRAAPTQTPAIIVATPQPSGGGGQPTAAPSVAHWEAMGGPAKLRL